ncbi:SprB repeat-containing protein [bacterium]|nr:SprB repeat-containing protein [bacterium]
MPEMKNNFQKGRMNKDLDERLVPDGEYRDSLNVEIATSNGSDIGTVQTLMGNTFLPGQGTFSQNVGQGGLISGTCIGSIADDKNDKLYYFVARGTGFGTQADRIVEYDYTTETFAPVCVDLGTNALKFDTNFPITGINIVDNLLFWTDNNSEPKKINIDLGKQGSSGFFSQTKLMVRDIAVGAQPNTYINSNINIHERHLTIIKKGPSTAPVLEMNDTTMLDQDNDGFRGGSEITGPVTLDTGFEWVDADGEWVGGNINIIHPNTMDYSAGNLLSISLASDRSVNVLVTVMGGGPNVYSVKIESGNKAIVGETDLISTLVQKDAFFAFKFPRFAIRYKYEDGEYSCFSPFSQPAFLPGKFDYMTKEGYNLGMVNKVRKLAIKDFVHLRSMGRDVVSLDILYKESNSSSVYSVKTIKRRNLDPVKWDAWNASDAQNTTDDRTKGYLPITSEMIHAVLPANQLLRPWDNVPRKALAQEVIGNRLVYGNYLQNYNLDNTSIATGNLGHVKVDLDVNINSDDIEDVLPEEIHAGYKRFLKYRPSKSIKSLRTYQLGVVYLDKYGRETPVFSEDSTGTLNVGDGTSNASVYAAKNIAHKRNQLNVRMKSNPPDWATHRKYFIKETSNEYYNMAMDRFYDAEDGNIWLSFPSAERNKVDEETFLILKKEHDTDIYVDEPARYKIVAIENEAPRFIKLQNISMGGIKDADTGTSGFSDIIGHANGTGFPFPEGFFITIKAEEFEQAGWKESLINQDISQTFIRVKGAAGISNYYRLKQITFENIGATYYKMEVGKKFGADMSFTSPTGLYIDRDQQCEVQVMKKIAENRAEFEGRFFVKILKDATLIKRLGIVFGNTLEYIPVDSMQVQYINPQAAQAPGGGASWFGKDKYKLSVSKDSDNQPQDWVPDIYEGHGENYWSKASKIGSNLGTGWFIDAVEGFKPTKGKTYGWSKGTKSIGMRWGATGGSWEGINPCTDWFDSTIPPRYLNLLGTGTYGGGSGGGYLNISGVGRPIASSGAARLRTKGQADGGAVAPSYGIDTASGIINLSYSGLNEDHDNGGYISDSSWEYCNGYFNDPSKHGNDKAFIDKLMVPGTVWRWKEDPDQVLYTTIQQTGLGTSYSPITANEFDKAQSDHDGQKGTLLYNYAVFGDWMQDNHHQAKRHWNGDSWCGGGGSTSNNKVDFISRDIATHDSNNCSCALCYTSTCTCNVGWWQTVAMQNACSPINHTTSGANDWGVIANLFGTWSSPHKMYPIGTPKWGVADNKRRRFTFQAEAFGQPNLGIMPGDPMGSGPHGYLPTNDVNFLPHFDASAQKIDVNPLTLTAFTDPAPGIRPDGMYSGYDNPGGGYSWDPDGTGYPALWPNIPNVKRWGDPTIEGNHYSADPGSVTWEIVEQFEEDAEKFSSTNPAIWETEPKEDVGLDIYYEVGQIYPIHLNNSTIEQFVGAVHDDSKMNSYVQCWDGGVMSTANTGTVALSAGGYNDVRIFAVENDLVALCSVSAWTATTPPTITPLDKNNSSHTTPIDGSYLMIWRADGSLTEAHAYWHHDVGPSGNQTSFYRLTGATGEIGVHNKEVRLPWFNCYAFGNGVESDRIRDDYNQVQIDDGPKASTTIETPYLEERRKNGFIWSGIYNSTSGVNDTNQFIQAEAITKDTNPSYGSIQKLHARDSDLVAFCEDRVLKVHANKDALYNADGNTNIVATNNVLGTIRPFSGDFGISLNPESFASDSHRAYFSDTSRGAVLRLSQDGITSISEAGMRDWFADRFRTIGNNDIFGSFDDNRGEYNITLKSTNYSSSGPTLSFSEKSKGWVSFKSFDQENGISLNNTYYTFSDGKMYQHHTNQVRNNFYGQQFDSSVDIVFNKVPGSIKSFSTLNYEGSQARITPEINDNPDYYDNFIKTGWYVSDMVSNAQELGVMEFWDKEDKWFSQIKGVATEWTDDGTAGNIDPREFSYQGIGNSEAVLTEDGDDWGVYSWNCQEFIAPQGCECTQVTGSGGSYATEQECLNSIGNCCGENNNSASFDCVDGSCTDPGNGSGQYPTYCECVIESGCCDEGLALMYTCQNIAVPSTAIVGCMDDGFSTNPFVTQSRPYGWIGPATNYNSSANVPDCDCTYLTSASWDCIEGNCVDPGTGQGQYSSLASCDEECNPTPPVSYDCTDGTCIDPGDGSGFYTSLQQCENNCLPVANSYDCIEGGCVGLTNNSGQYTTYQDCDENCGGGPCDDYPGDLIYNYAEQTGTCCGKCDQFIAGDPNHPCYDFCVEWGDCCDGIQPSPYSYRCLNNGNCVGMANNNGSYSTWQDCLNDCGLLSDPCEDYPGDNGCCGKCDNPPQMWGRCTPFCEQWKDCCRTIPLPESSYSCSTYSGMYTGFPQQYQQPYTCFEVLSNSSNQPIPFGDPGAGIYSSMADCINSGCEGCTNEEAYNQNEYTEYEPDDFCCNWQPEIITQTNPSCPGAHDGAIEVWLTSDSYTYYSQNSFPGFVVDPFIIITDGNGNPINTTGQQLASGLPAGTYNIDIFNCDDNSVTTAMGGSFEPWYGCQTPGCTSSFQITLTDPEELYVNGVVVDATPNESGAPPNLDGSVTTTVSGGTPPYAYAWSNGQTTANATGLGLGPIAVTVEDATGCTVGQSWFVLVN